MSDLSWPPCLTSCSTRDSTLLSRSTFLLGNATSSGNSWLMQLVWRLLHPSQMVSVDAAKVHRIFRRLHSQQDSVPFRILRFLGAIAVSATEQVSNRPARECFLRSSISMYSVVRSVRLGYGVSSSRLYRDGGRKKEEGGKHSAAAEEGARWTHHAPSRLGIA